MMSGDVPAHFFWFYVSSLLAFCPAVRWCGCPVVRLPGGLKERGSYKTQKCGIIATLGDSMTMIRSAER